MVKETTAAAARSKRKCPGRPHIKTASRWREEGAAEDMEAYCVKCKAKREMNDATETKMKNGKPAVSGTCSVCGTKMFKIGAMTTEAKS